MAVGLAGLLVMNADSFRVQQIETAPPSKLIRIQSGPTHMHPDVGYVNLYSIYTDPVYGGCLQ